MLHSGPKRNLPPPHHRWGSHRADNATGAKARSPSFEGGQSPPCERSEPPEQLPNRVAESRQRSRSLPFPSSPRAVFRERLGDASRSTRNTKAGPYSGPRTLPGPQASKRSGHGCPRSEPPPANGRVLTSASTARKRSLRRKPRTWPYRRVAGEPGASGETRAKRAASGPRRGRAGHSERAERTMRGPERHPANTWSVLESCLLVR